MCGFLLRRTRDPHLAEDLAQETFVKATRALLGWRGDNAAAWLLTIARHVLIDHARRKRLEIPCPMRTRSARPNFPRTPSPYAKYSRGCPNSTANCSSPFTTKVSHWLRWLP
nr:hypothetical protein GCM10020093_083890 [Planobispora longispora]